MSEQNNVTLRRANNAVMSRDFNLASRLYRNVLRTDSKNLEILLKLADCYVKGNNDRKALETYLKVIEIEPKNFKALNSLGGIYRRLGQYDNSIKVLHTALESGGDVNTINYNLGHTYKMSGDYDNASDCFMAVIDENPNDVLAYNHLGSINAAQGKHEKALLDYRRGLQIDPNHPILHYNAALSFVALKKYEQAKKSFENVLRSKPGWVEAMSSYSNLLLTMNEKKEAKALLKQAVLLNPQNIKIKNSLGEIYTSEGKYHEAAVIFKENLNAEKNNINALEGLESVYESQKKYLDAARILNKLEKIHPEDNEIALRFARVLMNLGRMHNAGVHLKEVLSRDSENTDALNLLAQYYIAKGKMKKVGSCYKRISEIDPYNVTYLRDSAIQLTKVGKYESAEKQLKKYLEKKPDDSDGWVALGQNYEGMHNWKKALEAYKKSIELNNQNEIVFQYVANLSKMLAEDKQSLDTITKLLDGTGIDIASGDLDLLQNSIQRRERVLDSQSDSYSSLGEDAEDVEEVDEPKDILELELSKDYEDVDEDFDEFLNVEISPGEDDSFVDDFANLELEDSDMVPEDIFEGGDEENYHQLDGLVSTNEQPIDTDLSDFEADQIDPFADRGLGQSGPKEADAILDVDDDGDLDFFNDLEEEPEDEDNSLEEKEIEKIKEPVNEESLDKKGCSENPEMTPQGQNFQMPQPQWNPQYIPNFPLQNSPQQAVEEDSLSKKDAMCKAAKEKDFELPIDDEPEEEQAKQAIEEPEIDDEQELEEEPEIDDELVLEEEPEIENCDLKMDDEISENKQDFDSDQLLEPSDAIIDDIEDEDLISDEELAIPKEELLDEDEIMMDKVRIVLHEVWENPPVKSFNTVSAMFSDLRDLCEYLPEPKYNEFLEGLTDMKLDYVISRLSGKPGLLSVANLLRDRGAVKIDTLKNKKNKSIRETVSYMQTLVEELPPKKGNQQLNTKVSGLLNRLSQS
ncbi:MAG: hypothetical protein BKP49_05935 [Treponema sp. CETP13]|nr:MAG: hypothetical protein BKP49_05935 [Treponema sp. CETP13]